MLIWDLSKIYFSTAFFLVSISVFSQVIRVEIDTSDFSFSDTISRINTSNPKADALVSYAKSFLGVPYRYGGSTPSGFDCSGFINYIFGNFGFSLVRTSYGLAELGETVSLSSIRPGDLMFFKGSNARSSSIGHVALVVEVLQNDIKFIHAANDGVRIDHLKTDYYIRRYMKSKRLDYGIPTIKE